MKLEIEIPKIVYQAEMYTEEDIEKYADKAFLIGEVMLKENGIGINLISENDRKELITLIEEAIREFILKRTGMTWEEDE